MHLHGASWFFPDSRSLRVLRGSGGKLFFGLILLGDMFHRRKRDTEGETERGRHHRETHTVREGPFPECVLPPRLEGRKATLFWRPQTVDGGNVVVLSLRDGGTI